MISANVYSQPPNNTLHPNAAQIPAKGQEKKQTSSLTTRPYLIPQYHLSSSHRPPHSSHGGSSEENASAGPSVDARQGPEHLQAPQGIRATGGSTSVANTTAGTARARSGEIGRAHV